MQKVSVIVTTYNRKYEVRRALDSIYAQTRKPYEILLIDDNSDDGTEEYIKSFVFDGLKYYRLDERKGPGAARNYGITQSKGDYIAFLDSDNEWYPTKLEEFAKVLDSFKDCDVIYSKYKKHIQFDTVVLPEELSECGDLFRNEIWFHNLADASASIYKKSFLEEIGLFSEQLMTNIDWELLLRGNKKRKIHMKKVDKVLTENWTMFDGISEDNELLRKEKSKILAEYANEFFSAITENAREIEQQYNSDREHYEEVVAYYKNLLARKNSFYQFLSKWMEIKLEEKSLAEKLLQKGFEKIAIYGAGKHGTFLYQDLSESDVQVVYFIDQNKDELRNIKIPVFTLEEELPIVDAIIVSPYLEFEGIKADLKNKCSYEIIALNKLVEW